jgi:ElaB/YqjD/DUF883 family membrane-anchored ribosome-binding protein
METNSTITDRSNRPKAGKRAAVKKAARKAAPAGKRVATKSAARKISSNGYGKSAAKLMQSGKSALGSAYSWADAAGRSLPRAARNIHMPAHGSVQDFVSDRPLILGAVGLGVGMAIGALLPRAAGMQRTTATTSRRK